MRCTCQGCGAVYTIPDEKIEKSTELRFSCSRCKNTILDFEAAEDGALTAFIWVRQPVLSDKLVEVLRHLELHSTTARNPQEALYRLRHNPYDLVVVDNEQSEMPGVLWRQINHLPMPARRKFMLCLLSETAPTFDRMEAFRAGANLIINVRDVEQSAVILSKGLKEYRSFYRIFWEEVEKKEQL
ncbi:MAG: zinc-ribbon domain-containing protein [Desulforhabdus sp.]|nr:zinc-ribbon domain-containing protein [Desulforhabdus sp.]